MHTLPHFSSRCIEDVYRRRGAIIFTNKVGKTIGFIAAHNGRIAPAHIVVVEQAQQVLS